MSCFSVEVTLIMRFFKNAARNNSKTNFLRAFVKPSGLARLVLRGRAQKDVLHGGDDVSTKKVFKKTTYEVPETKPFKSLNFGLLEKIHW